MLLVRSGLMTVREVYLRGQRFKIARHLSSIDPGGQVHLRRLSHGLPQVLTGPVIDPGVSQISNDGSGEAR